jgi:glycosyltransferase involved in cell wall biosynthesis
MFGWEFPPHISGGLGTACHGLTNSLSQENIDVLFVVPKLQGGESAERTSFINASDVPIEREGSVERYISGTAVDPETRKDLYTVLRKNDRIRQIEVPSTLSPYRSPSFEETSSEIEHWNYAIASEERDTTPKRMTQLDEQTHEEESIEPKNIIASYKFSGSYGPNLLEEVRRYAQVGAEIAGKFEFDVIHAHDWMTYLAGIAAKKISGKPLVVHVHATEYDRSGEQVDTQVRAIEQQGMAEADCVVTVSNWTKQIAITRYNIPKEKVEVVHNGIIPKIPSAKIFSPPPIGSHIVTFLGRITHQKGPLYFVEAARKVLDQIPDAHFVVAGSGDLLPLMLERIAQLRMSSRFHFTGFLRGKDIDKVWSMSNVYVMPSVSEPFGIAPLEAIQAGVPVIISNQSGVAEVMPHAIKVDFWDTRELAAAICSVLRYKSLSQTLALNSAKEIEEITWNSAAKKLTQLYYGLTEEQRCA